MLAPFEYDFILPWRYCQGHADLYTRQSFLRVGFDTRRHAKTVDETQKNFSRDITSDTPLSVSLISLMIVFQADASTVRLFIRLFGVSVGVGSIGLIKSYH